MIAALAQRGWGGLAATAGSQAMRTWRRAYLTDSVECHADPVALALERTAYVGGRVECGRLGHVDGPLWHLDIRSSYAAVMALRSLPSRLERRGEADLPRLSPSDRQRFGALAEVAIETPEPAYPATGARPTLYPVGRFRTTLCGPELEDALSLGRVKAVGRWAMYYLSPCLAAYARAVYSAREDAERAGDEPLASWAKRLLVALPGKLGQRGWHWEDADDLRPDRPWMVWYECRAGGDVNRLRALGGACQRERKEDWANDSVGAIASWVCAHGRMALLRGVRTAGWQHVVYYDTDSLVVDRCGYDALVAVPGLLGNALGQWRLLGCYSSAHLYGQKHYRIGERVVCAGAPGDTLQPGPTAGYWWYRRGAKRALLQAERPSAGRSLQHYARRARYTAGVVGPEGTVTPWVRGEF
jgi:hypothetical protein